MGTLDASGGQAAGRRATSGYGVRSARGPHQGHERLGGAGHDLDGLYRDTLHFSDRLAQTVGAGGAAVDQFVVQEAVAGFVVGEGEDVVDGPSRSSARSEVEFYVVFVLVEPGIEQEGLELHASTSKEKLVPVIDSASRRTDDFLVYER